MNEIYNAKFSISFLNFILLESCMAEISLFFSSTYEIYGTFFINSWIHINLNCFENYFQVIQFFGFIKEALWIFLLKIFNAWLFNFTYSLAKPKSYINATLTAVGLDTNMTLFHTSVIISTHQNSSPAIKG